MHRTIARYSYIADMSYVNITLIYMIIMSLFDNLMNKITAMQITAKLMQKKIIANQYLILGGWITFLKVKFYCIISIVVLLYSREIFFNSWVIQP